MTELSTRFCTYNQASQIDSSNEDENRSNPSTMRGSSLSANKCYSTKTFCYINPASIIESDYSFNDDLDSLFEGMTNAVRKVTACSYLKLVDKDSPEMISKRQEAYDKWLKSVEAREREKKRLQKRQEEKNKQDMARILEEAELKKAASNEKVKQWMKKKDIEAQKKLTRLNELKKNASDIEEKKPKGLKKAIDFQQWIEKKNDEINARKRADEDYKKRIRDYQTCRQSTAIAVYNKWREDSRNFPKPVPMSRGMDSLRASTTKIYVNPIPWSLD